MPKKDKRAKFIELAESRVNRAIKDLRLIGNLSNRSAYEFTEEDVTRMFRAIQRELDIAKSRFSQKKSADEGTFRLD